MCRIFHNLYVIKHFGKFHVISELFIFEPLYINSRKKYSSFFIQMNETRENWQLKKKIYTTNSTRGTVIIFTKWHLPPAFFLKINLSLLGNVRTEFIASCISTNDVLEQYFLCVKFQENLLNSLIGMGGFSGGVRWFRTPIPRIFKIYKHCVDCLLTLAIVRIPPEQNLDPRINRA